MSVYEIPCESTFLGHLKKEAQFAYQKDGILVVARVCKETQRFCEMVSAKSGEPIPDRADTVIAPCVWEAAPQLWRLFMGSMEGYPGDLRMSLWREFGRRNGPRVVTFWAYAWWEESEHSLFETGGVNVNYSWASLSDGN